MSYGRTLLVEEHILWEDISYRRICLAGRHLTGGISSGRTCLGGGHVLQEDVFLDNKCYREDMSYWRTYLTDENVLLEDMSYWRTCVIGLNIFL